MNRGISSIGIALLVATSSTGDIISCKTSFKRSLVKTLSIFARASITNGRDARSRPREKERERGEISKRLIIRGDGYPTFRVSREQMEMPRTLRTVERKIKDPFQDEGRERERP